MKSAGYGWLFCLIQKENVLPVNWVSINASSLLLSTIAKVPPRSAQNACEEIETAWQKQQILFMLRTKKKGDEEDKLFYGDDR